MIERDDLAAHHAVCLVHARVLFERLCVSTQPTDHTDEYHDSQQYQQVRARLFYRLFYGLLHLVLLHSHRSGCCDDLCGVL